MPDEAVRPFHIKQVGIHQVTLELGPDLTAKINVVVMPEGQPANQPGQQRALTAAGLPGKPAFGQYISVV